MRKALQRGQADEGVGKCPACGGGGDGFGVAGVTGAFERCCELTMGVLRDDAQSLLTILEVFIHDPLYRWMLSPVDARRRQRDVDEADADGAAGGGGVARGGGGGGAICSTLPRHVSSVRQLALQCAVPRSVP